MYVNNNSRVLALRVSDGKTQREIIYTSRLYGVIFKPRKIKITNDMLIKNVILYDDHYF